MHVLMHASVTHPDMLRSLRPRWQPISQRKLINKYHSLTHLTHSLTHSSIQFYRLTLVAVDCLECACSLPHAPLLPAAAIVKAVATDYPSERQGVAHG